MFMLIGAPAVTHGARRGVMCRPESPDFGAPLQHDIPLEHSITTCANKHRSTAQSNACALSGMQQDDCQHRKRLVSPLPSVYPPNTYRSLPTATMPWQDRALGREPETCGASSCFHCILLVENRKSSFEKTARSNVHPRVSASRHMTMLSSAGAPECTI